MSEPGKGGVYLYLKNEPKANLGTEFGPKESPHSDQGVYPSEYIQVLVMTDHLRGP